MHNIIVINPGATSTKIAFYQGERELFNENIQHDTQELEKFDKISDQFDYRYNHIIKSLENHKIDFSTIDAIAARGGLLPPVPSGALEVNEQMIDYLINRPRVNHASNLGAIIANKLKNRCVSNTKAFVYDPVTVDEYEPISRISGLEGVERESIGHALNMRATAMHVSKSIGKDYYHLNLIVAHLGGGNSISIHCKGKMIDSISDDEGPFSTERVGGLPVKSVINLSKKYSKNQLEKMTRKVGGLVSYLGTNDAREIEKRILKGDGEAELIFKALAYQVKKGIGSLTPVVSGKVDGIIITGGLAHSKILTEEISSSVSFIAPVYIVPGEKEMFALASGINRVLKGEEQINFEVEI